MILFALGELSGSEQGPMHAVLYGAGVVLCYHAVNLPLRLLLKALHLCYIPKTMTADAERCYAQLKSPASENRIAPECKETAKEGSALGEQRKILLWGGYYGTVYQKAKQNPIL